jgi:hypothetical protein
MPNVSQTRPFLVEQAGLFSERLTKAINRVQFDSAKKVTTANCHKNPLPPKILLL